MDNPYAAPLEHNEQPTQRSRYATLVELTWAFCAGLPILWFCGLISIYLIYGEDLPPTIAIRLSLYGTLLASLVLFIVSFVYNTLAALKRRWIGIAGVVINFLSAALIIGIAVLIVLITTGRIQ
jgi:phosphatidylserine synthase